MKFINGLVFREDGHFHEGGFSVENGVFTAESSSKTAVDLQGQLVLPGLVDTHIHGSGGADFSSGGQEDLHKMARYLLTQGITAFTPTTLSGTIENIRSAFQNARKAAAAQKCDEARIVGIHMEGPFFAAAKKGAQPEECLRKPDFSLLQELNEEAGGLVKIACVAPELEGALDFISQAKKEYAVSAAHTACNYMDAKAAFDAGITRVTHLFNAMNPLLHREPGLIGAAAEDERVSAELIADGVHVHESAVRAAFKLFGPDRIILISDGLSATGAETGAACYSGQDRIFEKKGAAVLADGVTFAGSTTTLFDCVRKVASWGIPAEWAVKAATLNPARSVGISHLAGVIKEGRQADFIVCDERLNRKAVYCGGFQIVNNI